MFFLFLVIIWSGGEWSQIVLNKQNGEGAKGGEELQEHVGPLPSQVLCSTRLPTSSSEWPLMPGNLQNLPLRRPDPVQGI